MSWFTSVGRVEVVRPHPRDMLGGQRRVPRLRARVRGWLRVVGEPAAEIVRATLRERVDLVVMGSHKVQAGWPAARVRHHKLQGGDLLPVPDPPCEVTPTATRPRSPPGARWQTDAMVLVEAADHRLELVHTPAENESPWA